jgi:hypothetical protein
LRLEQPGAERAHPNADPNAHHPAHGCVVGNVHNAGVVGDEPFVGIESASGATFANR